MTAHRSNRRWWQLPLGLLTVAGLMWAGPAAAAELTASTASTTTPPTTTAPALTLTWATVSPPTAPPPLAYASAVYDSDNKTVVLFGGTEADGALSNNTWVWNGSTWTDYPGSEIQAPPARELASMAFDPGLHQLILFGGQGVNGQVLGDTWAWNGVSWYQQNIPLLDQSPSPREGAAMAYDGAGDLVLFGGTGPTLIPPLSSTTTTTPPTTAPPTGSGTGSPPGSGLLGSMSVLGDTWLWTNNGWVTATVKGPSARSGAAMAYDASANDAVLFGGESTPAGSASPSLLGDTWAWNGTSWSGLHPTGSLQVRDDAAMTSDGLTGGLILFGGSGPGGALQDTWLWNGTAWAAAQTTGAPSPRVGAAAAFDDNSHQLVLFGGVGPGGGILDDTVILTGQAPVVVGTRSTPTSSPVTRSSPTTVPAPPPHDVGVRPTSTSTTSTLPPTASTPGISSAAPPLSESPRVLHRGALVTLSGAGFSPGATITITFHSKPTVVGRSIANGDGGFSATVAIPQSAASGIHHFEAGGQGPTGQMTELIATVEVVGALSKPATTVQKAVLLAAALLIPIGTWCFLVTAGWWRRRGVTAA